MLPWKRWHSSTGKEHNPDSGVAETLCRNSVGDYKRPLCLQAHAGRIGILIYGAKRRADKSYAPHTESRNCIQKLIHIVNCNLPLFVRT